MPLKHIDVMVVLLYVQQASSKSICTQELRLFLEEMKQLLFGLHLPVMEFSSCRSSIRNNSGNNNKKNGEKEKQQQSFTREQILSIAIKASIV